MIDIALLEQYFPIINNAINIDKYIFRIIFGQTDSTFIINLKIKQKSIPGEHLIKFRFGIGKDEPRKDASHDTSKPHFEIETYRRGIETISTTVYFTFHEVTDEHLDNYAKGTVVMINSIVQSFLEKNKLKPSLIDNIIFSKLVLEELTGFDTELINALAESFKTGNLIMREGNKVIKTTHRLKECLSAPELEPLLLPILEKAK